MPVGKNKTRKQIPGIASGYIAVDKVEYAHKIRYLCGCSGFYINISIFFLLIVFFLLPEHMIDIKTESGFKKVYYKYYASLFNTANKIINNREAAEDMVQEVFLKLWEIRENLQISTSIRSYLTRAVINTSLNYLKKSKRIVDLEGVPQNKADLNMNDTELSISYNEINKKLNQIISTLPPKCQMVFTLSRFEGMSNQQIADQMGITKKTVENQLNKALSKLREQLRPYIKLLTDLAILVLNSLFLYSVGVA